MPLGSTILAVPSPLSQLNIWSATSPLLVVFAALILAIGVVVVVYVVCFRGIGYRGPREIRITSIDWSDLTDEDPPTDGPRLDLYHLPVRLALLVLAPAGRQVQLPSADGIAPLLEQIVPGLSGVVRRHQPKFCRWPHQLSSEGFAKSFFAHVELPGHHGGRGSHECH